MPGWEGGVRLPGCQERGRVSPAWSRVDAHCRLSHLPISDAGDLPPTARSCLHLPTSSFGTHLGPGPGDSWACFSPCRARGSWSPPAPALWVPDLPSHWPRPRIWRLRRQRSLRKSGFSSRCPLSLHLSPVSVPDMLSAVLGTARGPTSYSKGRRKSAPEMPACWDHGITEGLSPAGPS